MSRKERFTPQEKEQACIDYIEGNRSRSEICRELYISTSTMNIPVRRVLPHENIQMVGLTTTELSNKTSNNWLNGIAPCPPIAAATCILSDNYPSPVILVVIPAQITSNFICMIRGQYFVCLTAKNVCYEIFSHLCLPFRQNELQLK